MGAGLTASEVRQIIGALQSIERELKIHNKREAARDATEPKIIRCKDCKHNPKITWFECPLAHCSETQRPETAWCWKAERREE